MISQGSIPASRSGTRSRWTSTPAPPFEAISESDDASPAAPQSCSDSTRPPSTSSRLRLDQLLARERVADLDRRPLVLTRVRELLARENAGAADAVPAGCRAVEDDEVAGPAHLRAGNAIRRQKPDAHRVDEAVVGVALVEDDLAADGRDADAVAVVPDACDRATEHPAAVLVVEPAEAQPVEQRDRPRAHGDDVAQDAADACRRALERLDGRRVVVALDLERDGKTVADVHDAGVLARALEHRRALGREPLQQQGGVLVATVLGPQQREDGELESVRLPTEQAADALELPVRQTERTVKLLGLTRLRRRRRSCSVRDRGQREITTLTTKEDRVRRPGERQPLLRA